MKKITFYDLFLLASLLIAIVGEWGVYECILLCAASVMELVDVVPKIIRLVKNGWK
jgi:hypothetical protein